MKEWKLLLISFVVSFFVVATPVFAQVYQSSASKQTAVGNAQLPDADAQKIIALVNAIRAVCPNGVVGPNSWPCISRVQVTPPLSPTLINQLTGAARNGNYLQCGQFAWAIQMYLGWPLFHDVATASMWYPYNWDSHYHSLANNGSNVPQVGDYFIWNGNPGHVAFVVNVYDPTHVQVAQANVPADGEVDLQNRSLVPGNPSGFVRKN